MDMKKPDFVNPESIPTDRPVAIYGYGSQGLALFDDLSRRGVQVVAFVDSYQSTEHQGIPVRKFEDVSEKFFSKTTTIIASTFWKEIARNFELMAVADVRILDPNGVDEGAYTALIPQIVNRMSRLDVVDAAELKKRDSAKVVLHGSSEFEPLGLPNSRVESFVDHHEPEKVRSLLGAHRYDLLVLCPRTLSDLSFYHNIISRVEDGVQLCILPPLKQYIKAFVVEELSFIYLPIPKCASSSIMSVLQAEFSDGSHVHGFSDATSPVGFIDLNTFDFSDYFTFTFMRDPIRRVASLYSRHLSPDRDVNDELSRNLYPVLCKEYPGSPLDFSDLVDFLSRCPDCVSDAHFRSQHQFITRSDGSLVTDYIGDLNDFNYHWNVISSHVGIPTIKDRKNTSTSTDEIIARFCTEELENKLKERYKDDLVLPRGLIERDT